MALRVGGLLGVGSGLALRVGGVAAVLRRSGRVALRRGRLLGVVLLLPALLVGVAVLCARSLLVGASVRRVGVVARLAGARLRGGVPVLSLDLRRRGSGGPLSGRLVGLLGRGLLPAPRGRPRRLLVRLSSLGCSTLGLLGVVPLERGRRLRALGRLALGLLWPLNLRPLRPLRLLSLLRLLRLLALRPSRSGCAAAVR
ncbi:hypothetical protein HNR06_003513 [Nocardiopsis arvandica]|uniref:Uncharacterized protein n=1 Tax=Nocardiopsis sinuspersici TaxID=501010 RepID=A0A7Y9XE30_9ACTN|nr:hypothetical protein [Nocardiopsis sinuspersici]NYH53924.1 hypothetical protein [Nocardiopsis sinuspersici]